MKATTYTQLIGAAALALCSVSSFAFTVPAKLLGASSTVEQAERSLALGSDTRHVNVKFGETVRFDTAKGSFAVKFDGVRSSFPLAELAPAGALEQAVTVYVAPQEIDERAL